MIDRSGETFKYVLAYLRGDAVHLPSSSTERLQLLADADFFQVHALWAAKGSSQAPVKRSKSLIRRDCLKLPCDTAVVSYDCTACFTIKVMSIGSMSFSSISRFSMVERRPCTSSTYASFVKKKACMLHNCCLSWVQISESGAGE